MPLTNDVGTNIKELRQANKIKPPGKKRGERQIKAIAIHAANQKMGVGGDKKRTKNK